MKSFLVILMGCCLCLCARLPSGAAEADSQVSIMHYFADELGHRGIKSLLERFTTEEKISVIDNPVGHEEFKTVVLQMAAESSLPDVIASWAGARTQFLADSGALAPLDDLWQQGAYAALIPRALAEASTIYNGQHYLVPFGYHAVGFFYNPKVFRAAGIEKTPQSWDEFLAACETLQQAGIKPLALGARNRWPAQFWFDYLLLRSAGPEFRQKLMSGQVSYLAPQVQATMQLWAELLKKGYFADGPGSDDWTDAADRVSSGKAAMTLMGTWIVGYWNGQGLSAEQDYDYFPFPSLDPQQRHAVVGPVDGLVIGSASHNRELAQRLIDFLLTDQQSQQQWAITQGAISPNRKVSPKIYNPVVRKALADVNRAEVFAFNYDLATSPLVAEQGLAMFGKFLQHPESYRQLLSETSDVAASLPSPPTSAGQK